MHSLHARLAPSPAGGRRVPRPAAPLPLHRTRSARRPSAPPPRVASAAESTDLDADASDPVDIGVYVFNAAAALHVGFKVGVIAVRLLFCATWTCKLQELEASAGTISSTPPLQKA